MESGINYQARLKMERLKKTLLQFQETEAIQYGQGHSPTEVDGYSTLQFVEFEMQELEDSLESLSSANLALYGALVVLYGGIVNHHRNATIIVGGHIGLVPSSLTSSGLLIVTKKQ
jgi:hypothetical protein